MRRAALVLLAVAAPGAAAANPLDELGFGARGLSMAGAVGATSTDVSANYYNPAGLARGRDIRLDLGYLYSDPTLELNGEDLNVDRVRGFQGGLLLPGELFGQRVGFSVGLHLPDERITRLRALPQKQPRFELYDNRPQRIVITSSAAVQLVGDLYFGAGLTYLSNTHGVLDVEGTVHLMDVERTRLSSRVDVDLEAVRYPSFGLMFAPGEHLRFGLVEREAFSLGLDLDVDVHGVVVTGPQDTPLVPEGRFLLNSVNFNLFSPRQVVLATAWDGGAWLVEVDVSWLQWSEFKAPTAKITIDLDLDPLPFSVPGPDAPVPPGFHDIFVPRVGAELDLLDTPHVGLRARAGYAFMPSPAPAQRGLTNYIDADKHVVAAGLGLKLTDVTDIFPKPVTLDVGAQLILMPERAYEKDDPADPIGEYRAQGRVVSLGVQLGLAL